MSRSVPPDVLVRSANYPAPQYNPNRRIIRQCPALHPHPLVSTRSQATSPFPLTDPPTQDGSQLGCHGNHLVSHEGQILRSATPVNQIPAFSQFPLHPIQPSSHQMHHCSGCRCNQNVAVNTTSQGTRPCRPPDYTMLAIVTCIFCNICLGAAAIIYSILSNNEAEAGNMKSATSKSKISLVLSVIGIFCGVIMIVFVVCFVVVTYK